MNAVLHRLCIDARLFQTVNISNFGVCQCKREGDVVLVGQYQCILEQRRYNIGYLLNVKIGGNPGLLENGLNVLHNETGDRTKSYTKDVADKTEFVLCDCEVG